jgi:hypothetical protein
MLNRHEINETRDNSPVNVTIVAKMQIDIFMRHLPMDNDRS